MIDNESPLVGVLKKLRAATVVIRNELVVNNLS